MDEELVGFTGRYVACIDECFHLVMCPLLIGLTVKTIQNDHQIRST